MFINKETLAMLMFMTIQWTQSKLVMGEFRSSGMKYKDTKKKNIMSSSIDVFHK